MRAALLKEVGLKPVIEVIDVDDPVAGDENVVIKVEAVGLCNHDVAVMKGILRRGVKENIILGHEISGTIVDTGIVGDGFSLGDRVVTSLTNFCGECESCLTGVSYRCPNAYGYGHGIDGGFREYLAIHPRNLIKVDPSSNVVGSSIYGCPIGVSFKALTEIGKVGSDSSVVVFGSGGGLGCHAMQIANSMGATVISFTTSPEKLETLQDLRSGHVFLIDEYVDPSELVMGFTNDKGADLVFNPVGGSLFATGLRCLSQSGSMLLLGEVTPGPTELIIPELMFRDASIVGCTGSEPGHTKEIDRMVNDGKILPLIHEEISMEDLKEGFRIVDQNEQIGRVIVHPSN